MGFEKEPRRREGAESLGACSAERDTVLFKAHSFVCVCPREESNLNQQIRNLPSYPLNDEGIVAAARDPAAMLPS